MKSKSFIAALLLLNVFGSLCVHAVDEGDVEWTGDWGYAVIECSDCGAMYFAGPVESLDEAWAELQDYFCDDCGYCDDNANYDCWKEHHCALCGDHVDEDYCHLCYEAYDLKICYDCSSDFGPENDHCLYCHRHFGEFDDQCGCEWGEFFPHCEGCVELRCDMCGECMVVSGEETGCAVSPACFEHAVCYDCMYDGDRGDEHCRQCFTCDFDVCSECHLCEACYEEEEHCPECDFCFGYGNKYEMCQSGGEHCVDCCEENDWLCSECGRCTEATGLEMCVECGLCEECCLGYSEDEGCTHGYCILSSEYEDHLCPECMKCPDDLECEYCLLCENCQENYHCEHNMCPDGDEWEEHLCVDCDNCFEMDELCAICHKCEGCNEHCEHGVCPDDPSTGDDIGHFTCYQCLECSDGTNRCEYCELCLTCCAANTVVKGCNHELCVVSDDFMEHWCYADGQCLEFCNHEEYCPHDPEDFYCSDATAHWQVCIYCGMAMNKALHTEGTPVTVVEPNPEAGKNGTAHVSCSVCAYNMGTVSIPFVPIPTDGSPYILIQPKDYTGKTNMNAKKDVPDLYTTFRVKAGGADLHYQWYCALWSSNFNPVPTDNPWRFDGAQTPTLTALVPTDACDRVERYYCVVSNAYGSVISDTVAIRAYHVFGDYENNGDGTHSNYCFGECDVVKSTSPHRWGEWKLVRAATDTQTGLREQKCLDCYTKNSIVIPKVEPGHEHYYDDLYYNETQHWYFCSCGLMTEPANHVFASPVVTKQPTETQSGEQVRYCYICDAGIKERLDKLPHVHDWYEANYTNYTTPGRGGYSSQQHFVCCKKCDQKNAEKHSFQSWVITSKATSSKSGRIARECWNCPYVEYKYYNYGTYPIMVEGGVANYDAARPGTPVTVTYTLMKNQKWENGRTYWKDMSSEGIGLVPVSLSGGGVNSTVTFIMPNGPVGLEVYGQAPCYHTGQTMSGSYLEPTCTGYGHETDLLCADCGAVVRNGARIEALGHSLVNTPLPGTEKIEYCYVALYDHSTDHYVPQLNPATKGYSGDFYCRRCHQDVKGRYIPLKHGYKTTRGHIYEDTTTRNYRDATCTGYGYSGDEYCNYCKKRASKGHRTEPLGHRWGEWRVVREASPTVKGLEQRVCRRDGSHIERRLTDYSGPHYKIQANKSKISFSLNYGEQPAPQTINFVSKGRNGVKAIKQVSGPSGSRRRANGSDSFFNVSVDGMTMTVMPDIEALMSDMTTSEKEVVLINSVITDDGEEVTDFNAPQIVISVKLNKADPNLHMERSVRNTRPGVSVNAPVVTSDVEGAPIEWKSSDYSVAAVDAVTGKVTPMKAYGSATITASYPGDQHYRSDKVSYTLNIINKQQHAGCIWQDVTDAFSGVQVKTDAEAQQVRILPTKDCPGKVDITFSGFSIPITGAKTPIFTVSGVNVTDYEDGTVIYDLPRSEAVWLTFGEGLKAHTYCTTLEGSQLNGFDIPVLRLTLDGDVVDIVWFGPEGMNLEEVIGTSIEAHTQSGDTEGVYDLSGRKLQRIQQPGVYIKEGRKVSVK